MKAATDPSFNSFTSQTSSLVRWAAPVALLSLLVQESSTKQVYSFVLIPAARESSYSTDIKCFLEPHWRENLYLTLWACFDLFKMLRGRFTAQSRKAHVNFHCFHKVWRELYLCLGFCNFNASFTILAKMTVKSANMLYHQVFNGRLTKSSHMCNLFGLGSPLTLFAVLDIRVCSRLEYGSQLPILISKGSRE